MVSTCRLFGGGVLDLWDLLRLLRQHPLRGRGGVVGAEQSVATEICFSIAGLSVTGGAADSGDSQKSKNY